MGDINKHTHSGAPLCSGSPGQQQASVPAEQPSEPARASSIHFSFDQTTSLVHAHLAPSASAEPLTLSGLRARLDEAGFGAYFTAQATLESVVQKANNRETGDWVITERRDARTEWRISDDKQAVYLTLHRAWGGQAVTQRLLLEELDQLGVPRECVLQIPLDEVVAMGQAESQILAHAIPAKAGQDARFESLVESERALTPVEDERGRVDMHELHDFIVVEPGTPLMRRLPATAGEAGINVVGEVLDPTPGKNLVYRKDCDGTEPDPNDPSVLLATIKGHPITLPQGIRVDPVLKLKNIDLSTGNVDFDGSIEVAGDVTSGFVLSATGDVVVRGMVEKADVYAGKNLTIAGGVMGEDQGHDSQGQLTLRTMLRAGENFSAKFINLAEVSAGRDLDVREYALQSHLSAGRDLSLGQPSGKGSLIGGWAKAGRGVVANVLGSEANVATDVIVGKGPRKRRLLALLRKEQEQCEHNRLKLANSLEAMNQGQGARISQDKLSRIRLTQKSLAHRGARLKALIERIATRQPSGGASRVQVKRQLHANVSVTIDGVRHTYHEDQGPSHLVRSGAELVNRS